ncbi:MAG: hypothetical protein MJE66_05320 [Proteobacteria bacterium]|nr:hypothetical protein [Pseudomonadota bacterium]
MPEVLLGLGGGIFLFLGSLHGLLTLRDLSRPRAFTPTDDAVREAMQGARLALNPRANLWKAWLGFNLSHSLGAGLFGGVVLTIAVLHFEFFANSPIVQATAVAIAGAYLVLSLLFWFWGPAVGSALSVLCLLGAVALR